MRIGIHGTRPSLPRGRPATPLFVIRSCRAIGSTSAVSRSLVSAQQSRRSGQRPQSACTLRQLWRKGRTSALRLLRRSLVLGNLPGSESRTNPLLHFIQHGAQAGHQPNPHFNTKWYVEHHPEAGAADTDPLSHYIYHGERRGFWPSPEFDPAWYISYYPDSALWPQGPFSHYLLLDKPKGAPAIGQRTTTRKPWRIRRIMLNPRHAARPVRCRMVSPAGAGPFPSIGSAGTLPVGRGKERTGPSSSFHTQWYLSRYPDVAESGQNALEHYVLYGASELRDPSEYFDVQQYCTEYAALIPAGANPLVHFLRHGARAGLNPNPYFDTRWYLSRYQRVTQSAFNPLVHYLIEGKGWAICPALSSTLYDMRKRMPTPSTGAMVRFRTTSYSAGMRAACFPRTRQPSPAGRQPGR